MTGTEYKSLDRHGIDKHMWATIIELGDLRVDFYSLTKEGSQSLLWDGSSFTLNTLILLLTMVCIKSELHVQKVHRFAADT